VKIIMNARNGANWRAEEVFVMAVIPCFRLDTQPMDEPAPLKFAAGQFWVSVPRRSDAVGRST